MKQRKGTIPPNQRVGRFNDAIDKIVAHYESSNQPAEVARWKTEKEKLTESLKTETDPPTKSTDVKPP